MILPCALRICWSCCCRGLHTCDEQGLYELQLGGPHTSISRAGKCILWRATFRCILYTWFEQVC